MNRHETPVDLVHESGGATGLLVPSALPDQKTKPEELPPGTLGTQKWRPFGILIFTSEHRNDTNLACRPGLGKRDSGSTRRQAGFQGQVDRHCSLRNKDAFIMVVGDAIPPALATQASSLAPPAYMSVAADGQGHASPTALYEPSSDPSMGLPWS